MKSYLTELSYVISKALKPFGKDIASIIYDYIYHDFYKNHVLKELLEKTESLLRTTETYSRYKNDENRAVHIFNSRFSIIYFDIYWKLYSPSNDKFKLTNGYILYIRKFNFLKRHNRETIIQCKCGKKDSISKYNEEDFLDNGKIECIH